MERPNHSSADSGVVSVFSDKTGLILRSLKVFDTSTINV